MEQEPFHLVCPFWPEGWRGSPADGPVPPVPSRQFDLCGWGSKDYDGLSVGPTVRRVGVGEATRSFTGTSVWGHPKGLGDRDLGPRLGPSFGATVRPVVGRVVGRTPTGPLRSRRS